MFDVVNSNEVKEEDKKAPSESEDDIAVNMKRLRALSSCSNNEMFEKMKSPKQAKGAANMRAKKTSMVVKGVKKNGVDSQHCFNLLECMNNIVQELKTKEVQNKQHTIVELFTMVIFGDPENGPIKLDLACQRALEMSIESVTSFLQLLLSGSYEFISSTVSEPLLLALDGQNKGITVVSGQHRVGECEHTLLVTANFDVFAGMLVGLLLGILPVSTDEGLRFLKKDETLPDDYEFTDDCWPDVLWGYKDYDRFYDWIIGKMEETDGALQYKTILNRHDHIFTW